MNRISDTQFNIAMKLAIEKILDDDIRETVSDGEKIPVGEGDFKKIWRAVRRADRKPAWIRALKRAAVIVLAVGTIGLGVVMSFEPVRAAFLDAVITWYENYIGVCFAQDVETDAVPAAIETVMKPTYVPDGWTMECKASNDDRVYYIFKGKDNERITYQQKVVSKSINEDGLSIEGLYIDNTNCTVSEAELEHITAKVISYSNGTIRILWEDEYAFLIEGYEAEYDTLIRIANSIQ